MIRIGSNSTPLGLDPGRLVGGCALVQGTRGSGKSYLVRVIAEQVIPAGLQTIILDPEGEFSTLRERCDVLIAGKGGDVPCEVRSAKVLARRVAELGISTICDLSKLRPDDQAAFVAAFLDALDRLPKALERSRLVVLDEAHRFCPESGKGRSVATDAVVLLMSQGRKRGLGGILVTQRLSKLRKDAAAEAANLFIFRTSPIDLSTAQDLLGVTAKDREALRTLHAGECYASGPGLDVPSVVGPITVREAKTTHPEPGTRWAITPPPPRTAVKRILAELRDLPPSAEEEEAKGLADAQRRIRQLEAEVRRAEQSGRENAQREYERVQAAERERFAEKIRIGIMQIIGQLEALIGGPIDEEPTPPRSVSVEVRGHGGGPDEDELEGVAFKKTVAAKRTMFVGKAHTILAALAQSPHPLTRAALAITAGMAVGGGSFGRYLSAGRSMGYWENDGERIRITDAGLTAAREAGVKPLPRGSALVDHWCRHKAIAGKARDMLRAVVEAGAEGIEREALASAIGMEAGGGSFGRYLSTLRSLGLVRGSRTLVAAEELRR